MIRDIAIYPDPGLTEICLAAMDLPDGLIEDMFETMYAAEGRGLAAPQIREMIRVFVMDATWKEGEMRPQAFVNPEITDHGGAQINDEACLSIPGQSRRVARPAWVVLNWVDIDGASQTGHFEGFAAACVCHEIDHLDGKLILDHPIAT